MYFPWILFAFTLPSMASQPPRPNPGAPPEEYRQQVSDSIRTLVSGQRPRDSTMSGASTGRLIVEGVVENLRIYRIHKQEKAKEGKIKEEEGRKSRRHRRDRSRERRHHRRSHSRAGDDERHRHRQRHRSANEGERHRRRRHRHRSRGSNGDRNRDLEGDHQQTDQRSRSTSEDNAPASSAQNLMSGALHAAEQLFGPDGTPFGSLPTRGKGVGFLAHVGHTYRHIKAEQNAGHRSKGFVEKHIGAFLQKKTNAKGASKGKDRDQELPIFTKSRDERGEDGERGRSRGRHRRSRIRKGEGRSGRDGDGGYDRDRVAGQPSDAQAESSTSSRSGRPGRQPTPFTQELTPPVQPSRRSSRHSCGGDVDPVWSRGAFEAGENNGGASRSSTIRSQSPAPSASVRSGRQPTPSVRGAPSMRDGEAERGARRLPTVRVQSPTPPEPAKSVRSPTPYARGPTSRALSPEPKDDRPLLIPTNPVRSPIPSRGPSPLPIPTPPSVVATPFPATPSVADMPIPFIPAAPPMPPPPPPPPPVLRPTVGPARSALLASNVGSVRLIKVSEKDKKDKSAARKDEARIEDVSKETPMYEGTPHSHDVEALENAQAVEERVRRQVEERAARTVTPLTAPQPRMKMPTNLQDELAAKLREVNLPKQGDDDVAEAGSSRAPDSVRPRTSSETWRTVFADQEEENRIPDRQFRQDLGDRLSAGGLSRPQTATPIQPHTRSGTETPAPDVFVNLAANVVGSGWQSGQGWDFSNVPDDGSSGRHGDKT